MLKLVMCWIGETSHKVESDHGKNLPKNVMEDVSWVHEELRLITRSMHALILM
jgi:hypothetical protein